MTPRLTAELVLLPALAARRGPNSGFVLTRKYMEGAEAYARGWPGPVTSLVRLTDDPPQDLDPAEFQPGDSRSGIEVRPTSPQDLAARLASAAAVVALLSRDEAATARLCRQIGVPVIFVTEYSARTERQILAAEVASPLIRLRRQVWLWRTERIRRSALAHAAGLQCSGTPTFEAYAGLCRDTILFFDNRVARADVASDAVLAAKAAHLRRGKPLRLVFGGRLAAMKGVMDLPEVAGHLARMGVPFTLDIYGDGPLRQALRSRIGAEGLSDRVALRGVLDFAKGWVPHLRDGADVFVCCHPQGDPSSTYPEVMSCGVPIAGYDNEAFRGVVAHSGSGWTQPMGDARALAGQLAALHADRDSVVEAARRARDFALRHAFEATFDARIAHILRNSRLPGKPRVAAP
jgi:glycosyltransferase involved in cell wall biosynthesis